ncbi:MAG: hypothetical protein PUD22_09880 [Erysipelotrichaceae bacterium]|nr:hypothetical protein [Erysipelotrichaceae bacterium]
MKYREIGSEFWNIPQGDENHLFSNDTRWFISGRAALDHILKDIMTTKEIRTAAMPSWCCDTMIEPFLRNGIAVSFYPVIIKDGRLYQDYQDIKADVLLKMEYFGYEAHNDLPFAGTIISDISHSIFTDADHDSDYVFGSLRKWAGFKTGGFASCKEGFKLKEPTSTDSEYVGRRKKAMALKSAYISGLSDDKGYLDIYVEAEESLVGLYDLCGDKEDIEAAKHLDLRYLKERRRANAKNLLAELGEYALFKEMGADDCPLFVPIIIDNRDELRKYLIDHAIYCPIHWPISPLHQLSEEERYLYDHELSLICDQRYDLADIREMTAIIKQYLKEKTC